MRWIKLLIAWLAIFCSLVGTAHAGVYSFTTLDFPLSGGPQNCVAYEETQPFAINNAGVILGFYSYQNICNNTIGEGGFTYLNGVFDPPGITYSGPLPAWPLLGRVAGTNDFGATANTSNITCPPDPNGDPAHVGPITDINDSGVVLVNCESTLGPQPYTFYNGVLTPALGLDVLATDINNLGQVVGHYDDLGFTGCSEVQCPWAINDLGEIVGFGPGTPGHAESGFLISTVSEPSTLPQLAISILLLLGFTTFVGIRNNPTRANAARITDCNKVNAAAVR